MDELDLWSQCETIHGYAADEVRSSLQKSIRRGLVEDAVLAAYELYLTGPESEELLWRRLEVIAAEDVGCGWDHGSMIVEVLGTQRRRVPRGMDRWIFAAHAVRLLTAASKDRTSGELAAWCVEVVNRGERHLEIPDVAVDMHTRRGREQGRDESHFYAEGSKVEHELPGRETKWRDYLVAVHGVS